MFKKKLLKTEEEIFLIKKSAELTSKTFGIISKELKPGINGIYLNNLAEEFIYDNGGKPAFLGLNNFKYSLCISPNNKVVHCVPDKTYFKEGDLISIDCGVIMNDFYSDQAYTFFLGDDPKINKFIQIVKNSLYIGISNCKNGNKIGDIGFFIQNYIESKGYSIVKEFVGHGIGRKIHEEPMIPNYGKKNTGETLKNGMVLAIEPIVNIGKSDINIYSDGYTVTTKDNKISAHFENTICIVNGNPKILSTCKYIDKKFI